MYIDPKINPKIAPHHSIDGVQKLIERVNNMQAMLIFTNTDISNVIAITDKYKIEKQAKDGAISPINVILKAGPTRLDPSHIELFQALKIPTAVIKGQLEIIREARILSIGQKINLPEINIMKKFNIKPYIHQVNVRLIYMSGKVYGSEILRINEEILKKVVVSGINNVSCLSLSIGVPTKASALHIVMGGLTKLLGLKIHTGLEVAQLIGGAYCANALIARPDSPKKEDTKKRRKDEERENPEEEDYYTNMDDLFG